MVDSTAQCLSLSLFTRFSANYGNGLLIANAIFVQLFDNFARHMVFEMEINHFVFFFGKAEIFITATINDLREKKTLNGTFFFEKMFCFCLWSDSTQHLVICVYFHLCFSFLLKTISVTPEIDLNASLVCAYGACLCLYWDWLVCRIMSIMHFQEDDNKHKTDLRKS